MDRVSVPPLACHKVARTPSDIPGIKKSRPATLGRDHFVRNIARCRWIDERRKSFSFSRPIAQITHRCEIRFAPASGTNERSLVSRKQSTCLRACAAFVISIETCADPFAKVTGAPSHVKVHPNTCSFRYGDRQCLSRRTHDERSSFGGHRHRHALALCSPLLR